jgi:hypothetical protein
MTPEEREQHNRRVDAEIMKLVAETSKLNAESAKPGTENRWYLLVIGSAATLAIVAVAKLFL